jgi:hypothetical protein
LAAIRGGAPASDDLAVVEQYVRELARPNMEQEPAQAPAQALGFVNVAVVEPDEPPSWGQRGMQGARLAGRGAVLAGRGAIQGARLAGQGAFVAVQVAGYAGQGLIDLVRGYPLTLSEQDQALFNLRSEPSLSRNGQIAYMEQVVQNAPAPQSAWEEVLAGMGGAPPGQRQAQIVQVQPAPMQLRSDPVEMQLAQRQLRSDARIQAELQRARNWVTHYTQWRDSYAITDSRWTELNKNVVEARAEVKRLLQNPKARPNLEVRPSGGAGPSGRR